MAEVANGEVRPGLEVDDPRSNLVFAEGLVESDYQVGTIVLGDSTSTSAIICITEVDNQLLVALPVGVWHKKPVKRLFSPRGLSKVLQCSVVASQDGDRETAAPDRHVKVWIGLLAADLEPQIEFVFDQDPDHPFLCDDGQPGLPFAAGLVEVASERFIFQSAVSQPEEGGGSPGEGRLKLLEDQMAQLQSAIQTISERLGGHKPTAPAPKQTAKPGFRTDPGAAVDKKIVGLDPQVVDAARRAGVPEDHLAEMAQIVAKGPTRMEDVPRRPVRGGGALSESEADEEEVDAALVDGAGASGDAGVAKAIVKLTKMCSHLAAERKSKSKDPIEQILDSGASGSGDVSGLGSSRKNAAALRALKKCLAERPSYIYETIESHLEEDFAARSSRPGQPLGGNSAGVAGKPLSNPKLCGTHSLDLGSGRHLAGFDRRSTSGSPCKGSIVGGGIGSSSRRQRLMADQSGGHVGSSGPLSCLRESPASLSPRFATQCSPGYTVDGAFHQPHSRDGQLPGVEEETRQAQCCEQGEGGEARSQTKAKGQGKKQRRRKELLGGRNGGGVNASGSYEHYDSACKLSEGFQKSSTVSSKDDSIRVPGSKASEFSGRVFFNKLMRFLMNSRSGLGSFARSSVGLARTASLMSGATGEAEKLLGRGFPIPLPYPEALRKKWFSTPEDVARKKFLNSAICVLNFLHLGRPAVCPPCLNVGQQLSSMQWGVVRRLELLVDDWVNVANIGPEEMGRTAPKIESIEESISRLSRLAQELRSSADHAYVSTAISSAGVPTKMDVGEVVGSTGTSSFSTFKSCGSVQTVVHGFSEF